MVKKPRNDAQIKVEHVAEFVGKQGQMRDDLIEGGAYQHQGTYGKCGTRFGVGSTSVVFVSQKLGFNCAIGLAICKKKVLPAAQFQHCLQVAGMVSIVMRKL